MLYLKKSLLIIVLILLFQALATASIQEDFFSLLNRERVEMGGGDLHVNEALQKAAQVHADDMAKNNYFSHTSLNGKSFAKRIKETGISYIRLGENIAYHYGEPNATNLFLMWKNSPSHYDNMISSYFNGAGLGISYNGKNTYYVLDLGGGLNNNSVINPKPINFTNTSKTIAQQDNFTVLSINNSRYKKVIIKAKLGESASVYYIMENKTKRICRNCNRFYLKLKLPMEANSSIDIMISRNGQNVSYNFIF